MTIFLHLFKRLRKTSSAKADRLRRPRGTQADMDRHKDFSNSSTSNQSYGSRHGRSLGPFGASADEGTVGNHCTDNDIIVRMVQSSCSADDSLYYMSSIRLSLYKATWQSFQKKSVSLDLLSFILWSQSCRVLQVANASQYVTISESTSQNARWIILKSFRFSAEWSQKVETMLSFSFSVTTLWKPFGHSHSTKLDSMQYPYIIVYRTCTVLRRHINVFPKNVTQFAAAAKWPGFYSGAFAPQFHSRFTVVDCPSLAYCAVVPNVT